MRKLLILLMIACLTGCASAPVKAPSGCDNSLLWKSGFMPGGQDLVELGFAALLTADAGLMPQVKTAAIRAWQIVQNGTLKGAVTELVDILDKKQEMAPLAKFALKTLNLDQTIDQCDQQVLLDLFHNIGLYAGARDGDFTPAAMATLDSPQQ